ncbi:BFD-like [2Fe-2S] binding protein [Natranaerovirga pectinivora]|uniref:BFD-like [2Fe-2S] binding protein n=1 Tax=Natranaerovirga pectinivora TaxID=682400 RepID=A0A4R3MNK7_9FIRM|nr:(2Fe-2S)-binding protein [Natranaerovirga pectinivora]TCT16100.1 BFD-like [2Fe-2S] binding protein [Natranaerovirga pectinivora]
MCNEIICRCEEITKEEIEKVIEDGAQTANEIKRFTRAGMGLCQGRTCRGLVERLIKEKTGIEPQNIVPSGYRQPVRPIKIGQLGLKNEQN